MKVEYYIFNIRGFGSNVELVSLEGLKVFNIFDLPWAKFSSFAALETLCTFGDLEGDFEGDLEGDLEADFEDDFEVDLLRLSSLLELNELKQYKTH